MQKLKDIVCKASRGAVAVDGGVSNQKVRTGMESTYPYRWKRVSEYSMSWRL